MQLSTHKTVLRTVVRLNAQATGPELSFAAEPVRGLHQRDQTGGANRTTEHLAEQAHISPLSLNQKNLECFFFHGRSGLWETVVMASTSRKLGFQKNPGAVGVTSAITRTSSNISGLNAIGAVFRQIVRNQCRDPREPRLARHPKVMTEGTLVSGGLRRADCYCQFSSNHGHRSFGQRINRVDSGRNRGPCSWPVRVG